MKQLINLCQKAIIEFLRVLQFILDSSTWFISSIAIKSFETFGTHSIRSGLWTFHRKGGVRSQISYLYLNLFIYNFGVLFIAIGAFLCCYILWREFNSDFISLRLCLWMLQSILIHWHLSFLRDFDLNKYGTKEVVWKWNSCFHLKSWKRPACFCCMCAFSNWSRP